MTTPQTALPNSSVVRGANLVCIMTTPSSSAQANYFLVRDDMSATWAVTPVFTVRAVDLDPSASTPWVLKTRVQKMSDADYFIFASLSYSGLRRSWWTRGHYLSSGTFTVDAWVPLNAGVTSSSTYSNRPIDSAVYDGRATVTGDSQFYVTFVETSTPAYAGQPYQGAQAFRINTDLTLSPGPLLPVTPVLDLPYGSDGWKYSNTVTNGVNTSDDTFATLAYDDSGWATGKGVLYQTGMQAINDYTVPFTDPVDGVTEGSHAGLGTNVGDPQPGHSNFNATNGEFWVRRWVGPGTNIVVTYDENNYNSSFVDGVATGGHSTGHRDASSIGVGTKTGVWLFAFHQIAANGQAPGACDFRITGTPASQIDPAYFVPIGTREIVAAKSLVDDGTNWLRRLSVADDGTITTASRSTLTRPEGFTPPVVVPDTRKILEARRSITATPAAHTIYAQQIDVDTWTAGAELAIGQADTDLYTYVPPFAPFKDASLVPYSVAVTGDSPVAYWRCDDAPSAVLMDFTGHGHNASGFTGTGAIRQTASLLSTEINRSMSLGQPGYFTIPSSSAFSSSSISVEFWTDHGNSGSLAVYQHDDRFRVTIVGGAGRVYAGAGTNTLIGSTQDASWCTGGTAKQLGVSCTGSILRFWKNGAQYGPDISVSVTLGAGTGGPKIGTTDGNDPLGRIDEVAVYDTALSADRWYAHWLSGTTTLSPAMGGYRGIADQVLWTAERTPDGDTYDFVSTWLTEPALAIAKTQYFGPSIAEVTAGTTGLGITHSLAVTCDSSAAAPVALRLHPLCSSYVYASIDYMLNYTAELAQVIELVKSSGSSGWVLGRLEVGSGGGPCPSDP